MSVDKFGRYSHKMKRRVHDVSSMGFIITPTGDISLGNKKIVDVLNPSDLSDVVTKQYLDNRSKSLKVIFGKRLNDLNDSIFKQLKSIEYKFNTINEDIHMLKSYIQNNNTSTVSNEIKKESENSLQQEIK